MTAKTTKIARVVHCIPLICIMAYLAAWNTGCSSCNDSVELKKRAHDKGYDDGFKKGEAVGYERGYEKGEMDGYEKGYKKGDSDGYTRGYKVGHEDGHKKGYQEGTSAFLGKWWKPSLGMVIIALIFIFTLSALYYILRKPTRRLITQLETQTENYLKQKKLNKELERKIKIMEEREKRRFTLRVQELYDSACLSSSNKDNQVSLERLVEEAKISIQKAQINELEGIVSNYEEKFQTKAAVYERETQKKMPKPKIKMLHPAALKALPEGRA